MGKLLELAAAVFFVWLWLDRMARWLRAPGGGPRAVAPPAPPPPAAAPVALVPCSACGVFVPETRALRDRGVTFCSEACRQRSADLARPG